MYLFTRNEDCHHRTSVTCVHLALNLYLYNSGKPKQSGAEIDKETRLKTVEDIPQEQS